MKTKQLLEGDKHKRTQVDMPDEMRDELDKAALRKGIHHRAELIRLILQEWLDKEQAKLRKAKNESTRGGISRNSNDRSRQKRRAG